MDDDTVTRYSKAYGITPEAIRVWFGTLPADVKPVVARCFHRGSAPEPRDGADWAAQYRLYEQGSQSFAAFVFGYIQETLL